MLIAFNQAKAEAAGITVELDPSRSVVRFTFADGSGPAECFIDGDGKLDVIPERCVEHRKLARVLA